jgi:hypothetical protein
MAAIVGHLSVFGQKPDEMLQVSLFGDTLHLQVDEAFDVPFGNQLSAKTIMAFHRQIGQSNVEQLTEAMLAYKNKKHLNDWLYYQMVRHIAQQIAPKHENYYRYTLYKWYLMVKSGFDATLNLYNDQLLFYIYSQDDVMDLPRYEQNGRTYICLNIHDYIRGSKNFCDTIFQVPLKEPLARMPFSYKVTRLPEFESTAYAEKLVKFPYKKQEYHFQLKVNEQLGNMFTNYPNLPFEDYFNIPLSKETYQSLVPMLRKKLSGLKVKKGVEYLMHFTRYAFLYEDDQQHYGKEKRMSPEVTLLSAASDCDDRAALFFYLVKEIYQLPMVALVYPHHITIAVQLDKPVGYTIEYEGQQYTICEPTPQKENLGIGRIAPQYRTASYEIVYAWKPPVAYKQ